jgi:hypothetical protein
MGQHPIPLAFLLLLAASAMLLVVPMCVQFFDPRPTTSLLRRDKVAAPTEAGASRLARW